MTFNYKEEYKKWISEKEIEEELLRTLGVSEDVISELRAIDKNIFNSNRRFYRHENVTGVGFFTSTTDTHNFKDISKLEVVLDELENEIVCEIISKTDEVTYKIIELKYQGYTIQEISNILGIGRCSILRRIKKLKNLL